MNSSGVGCTMSSLKAAVVAIFSEELHSEIPKKLPGRGKFFCHTRRLKNDVVFYGDMKNKALSVMRKT